jgi:hypothetical protein
MTNGYTPIFDDKTALQVVIGTENDNVATDTELYRDIQTAPYGYLLNKYGKDIADSSYLYHEQRVNVDRIQNSERSVIEATKDLTLGAASGLIDTVGSIASGTVGIVGAAQHLINPESNSISKFATEIAQSTNSTNNVLNSYKSKKLRDRQELSSVRGSLDSLDNINRYNRETDNGKNANFIDELAWFGRGVLNNLDRITDDGAIVSDVIAQGLGSLVPSAKIASAASKLVTGSKTYKYAKIADAIRAPGDKSISVLSRGADFVNKAAIAGSVGLTEGAGVYSSTVTKILDMTHEELMKGSERYNILISKGINQEDAKAEVAAIAGIEAFARQFPEAAALGMFVSKFEASPVKSFKGSNIVQGLRSIGAETLEEGGQSLTGKYNQNIAIRDNVDPTQKPSEDIDQEFAMGAIAGAGMAGVLSTPATISGTPRAVSKALKANATKKIASIAKTGIIKTTSVASKGVSDATKIIMNTEAGKTASESTKKTKNKIQKSIKPMIDKATESLEEYNQRISKETKNKNIKQVSTVISMVSDVINNTPENVKDKNKNKVDSLNLIGKDTVDISVPKTFKDTVPDKGTVLSNLSGILQTLSKKGVTVSKLNTNDLFYVSSQVDTLVSEVNNLPSKIRKEVKSLLAAPEFRQVKNRLKQIDLNNTQNKNTEVTPTSVNETLQVAKTNPSNVNPEFIQKVLEQDKRNDITDKDIRILKEAKNIALALNTRIGNEVKFVKDENKQIKLIAKKENKKPNLKIIPENVTRDIALGFEFKEINGIKSIKSLVSDIFIGSQNKKKQFIDSNGISVDVKKSGTLFNHLAQHMVNKVNAFNKSYDGRNVNNRGSDQKFTALIPNKGLVKNGSSTIVYQAGTPNGIKHARTVHADAVMTVEAYNATVRAFPDAFPKGELSVPELRGFESKKEEPTTIVEEETGTVEAQAEDVPVSDETKEENKSHPVVDKYNKKIKNKKTNIIINNNLKSLASYSKKNNQISINIDAIISDFKNKLKYLYGDTEGKYSAQKSKVFENIDKDAFREFILEKGVDTYIEFIIEHEFERVRQTGRGEKYPRTKSGEFDFMSDVAISMERAANQAGFKAIGFKNKKQHKPENSSFNNIHPEFNKHFIPKDKDKENDIEYFNGEDLLSIVAEQSDTEEYVFFVSSLLQPLVDKANERLAKIKTNKSDKLTIKERVLNGEDTTKYRRNKNTMMIDQSTGEYNYDLISIAAIAVLDWLTTVQSSNVNSLNKTLEKLGLHGTELNNNELNTLTYGVPTKDVAERLAKNVTRMWKVKINKDSPMVDARGSVEGLVKELLESLLELDTSLISKEKVPFFDPKDSKIKKASFYNVFNMYDIQDIIGLKGQGAVTKLLTPELNVLPSFGEKIEDIDTTQSRGNIKLTDSEKTAIKNIQDTPHKLADNFAAMLLSDIDNDDLSKYLGYKDLSNLGERHPLRASIFGKNISIKRDIEDAQKIAEIARNKNGDGLLSVFYRVAISRVGRHQFKGINPQNNKILRAILTPTHAILDMTTRKHKKAFWLTVAQASGINKVENENHRKILSEIQDKFNVKFGDAVSIAENYINSGDINSSKFIEAMGGTGDVQQISAVFAVAQLNIATKNNTLKEFKTTLSFELDGKTDGPANMMLNFGQGLLTLQDFENFKRVGFFLGTKTMTLNKYFGGEKKNKDFYEYASEVGMKKLYTNMDKDDSIPKYLYHAILRFATSFGDLEYSNGQFKLTRDTSKNPMTKTVYGSSELGIGTGLSKDILLGMYQALVDNPEGLVDYVGGDKQFREDFFTLFGYNVGGFDWKKKYLNRDTTEEFTKLITKTLGTVLSKSAKSVIGNDITRVSDTFVLMTSFQTEFLTAKFEELLEAKLEQRAKEGKISLNSQNKPNKQELSQKDYDDVINEISKYSPMYANGMQTLALGSMVPSDSGIKLSEAMDGALQAPSTMLMPKEVGVKFIPYITQGRGDAMMITRIYSDDNFPKNTLPIFDGIDMPIDKIGDYAQTINKAVLANWDADIIGDIVNDMEHFVAKVWLDPNNNYYASKRMIEESWDTALRKATKKKTTSSLKNYQDIQEELIKIRKANMARKKVFKRISVSVDHMGGSDTAYVRGPDREFSYQEINDMILDEMNGVKYVEPKEVTTEVTEPKKQKEEKPKEEGLVVTDYKTIIKNLVSKTSKKHVKATILLLKKMKHNNPKVIIGSFDEVSSWYENNVGKLTTNLKNKNSTYDPLSNTIIIVRDDTALHEVIVHEFIHATTFSTLEDHYKSGKENNTITRLENLMDEFMNMDFTTANVRVRNAVNSSKRQILEWQSVSGDFAKAAALNEFMAWSLSNEALMKELKTRNTTTVSKLTKMVKLLMQRLLGGIPTSMYDNILFNTELLVEDIINIHNNDNNNNGGNGDNNGNGGDNDDGNLTPSAHSMSNFWIDIIRKRISDLEKIKIKSDRSKKQNQIMKYHNNADKILKELDFAGFGFNSYERNTFTAIHTVLALELTLNTQASIAMNDLFVFVTDNLKPEMFESDDGNDKYSTVMNLFGSTKNDQNVSDAIAVLLALSQTSKSFRDALSKLSSIPDTDKGKDIVNLMNSLSDKLISNVTNSIDLSGKEAVEMLDLVSKNILIKDSENEFKIIAGLMKNVDKADAFLSGNFSKLANYSRDKGKKIQESNANEFSKQLVNIVVAATDFLDKDKAKLQADAIKRVTHIGIPFDLSVFVREFVSELVGTDDDNKNLIAILDRANFSISSVRQDFREDLPVILQDIFKNHPNKEQWESAYSVLGKTDFSKVFSLENSDKSFRLISDENYLDKKIKELEEKIKTKYNKKTSKIIFKKGKQLADFQNNKGAGFMLWRNAYAINKLSGAYNKNMTEDIDMLVSYYAIKASDPKQRINITNMYKKDPEGVKALVTYTKALNKEEDLKEISDVARMNGYKGYIPSHGNKESKLIIASDDLKEDLEKQGYVRVGSAIADESFAVVKRGYYTTNTKQTGAYSQGGIQTVQSSYRGVDVISGVTLNGTTSGVVKGISSNDITKILKEDHTYNTNISKKEVLLPVYKGSTIIYYERALNPDLIKKYMKPETNMALMLGSWAGRQVEEKFAKVYNEEIIKELKSTYDNRGFKDDGLFINLYAEAEAMELYNKASKYQRKHMRKPDPIYVDSWNVIPPETKKDIFRIFGDGSFYVRKDQINISLGYRDPSIVDMWTGNTRVPKLVQESVKALSASIMGKKAMRNITAVETGIQGAVSTAKDLIVIRSLIVPYMNTQANIFQLQTRGIGFKQMWKEYPNKLAEIEQYNKNIKNIMILDTKILLASNDKNRVEILNQQKQTIMDQNKRFSIAPLIKAGAYKNISEGITDLDVEITSGKFGDWVEGQINKLPSGIQTIAKYGLLSKDTAIYKGANKAIQYGDFIAKAIYYDHLIKKKKLNHDEAIKLVNEEFVNFSTLPGRTRTYLEGIGLTWFLTFKIRIAKIALNQIRENPLRSLITGVSGVDGPITDNLISVIADNRLGYSLGTDMFFGAVSLNPWVNVTDWASTR